MRAAASPTVHCNEEGSMNQNVKEQRQGAPESNSGGHHQEPCPRCGTRNAAHRDPVIGWDARCANTVCPVEVYSPMGAFEQYVLCEDQD